MFKPGLLITVSLEEAEESEFYPLIVVEIFFIFLSQQEIMIQHFLKLLIEKYSNLSNAQLSLKILLICLPVSR